jgi:ATP-dependent DNA helicase RecQ
MKFLRRHVQRILPHLMYPPGFQAEGRKRIPDSERLEPGIALSSYGDAGWGQLVREGKYQTGRYPDDLIAPSVAAIQALEDQVDWLAWIPSLRHPGLLPDFAKRLASALGIPAVECVIKSEDRQPQKEMQNSTRQFQNAWSAFSVDPTQIKPGNCILVDDIVDSGWTLTAVGARLRQAGVGAVIPFALATAKPRGDA